MENFNFKKSFGQNFLQDQNIIKNIVNETHIEPDSLVIEIGPGSGALTRELCSHANQVLCYEIDERLEDILDENLVNFDNVDIIFDDFLKRDIKDDLKRYPEYKNLYVCANLPYYITTPILEKLIQSKVDFKGITIMIQKEVGDRFCANVGTRDYSSITVFLNYYYNLRKCFIVSRNCFIPKPNVDSIVINLSSKEDKLKVLNESLFFHIIRDSFRFKRKNLRNNLKTYNLEVINKVLNKHNLDLTVRAEDLSLELFVEIANALEDQ